MSEATPAAVQASAPSPSPAASPSSPAPAPAATATPSPASTPTPTTPTPTAAATPAPASPPVSARPIDFPESLWDGEKNAPNSTKLNEILVRDAAEQSRRLSLPQKPEDVKLELPQDFKLPQGVEFKFDPAKPEFSKLQAAAIKHGLTQDAVTDLVGVYAETLVGSEASIQTAKAAELGKLGANATARVTALQTGFEGLVGADKAKALSSMLVTAGIVEAMESVLSKFVSQGAASFSQAHRVAPEQDKIPGYETMSFEQRRFAQDQRPRKSG